MRVIDLPGSLDFKTYEQIFGEVAEAQDDKVLFDGRHLRFIDPNGMVNLLAAGSVIRTRGGEPARLEFPEQSEVAGYMSRMGFFRAEFSDRKYLWAHRSNFGMHCLCMESGHEPV